MGTPKCFQTSLLRHSEYDLAKPVCKATRTWKRSTFIKKHHSHSHLAIKPTLNHFTCPSFRMISTGCQQTRWNHIIYRPVYIPHLTLLYLTIHPSLQSPDSHFLPPLCFCCHGSFQEAKLQQKIPRNSSANCEKTSCVLMKWQIQMDTLGENPMEVSRSLK